MVPVFAAASEPDVALFLGLLIAVTLVQVAVNWVRIPYTVGLVIAGLALALLPHIPRLFLTPGIILTVFLPVLLFYGAYNLDARELRANMQAVTFLAIPGVIITAAFVAAALHFAVNLPWAESLVFGTIVAATDPVAVLAVFGDVGAPRRLTTIVSAESLFNDGTALVFFSTPVTLAMSHTVNVGNTVEQFALAVGGSLALGIAVGVLGSFVVSHFEDALLETTITLIMAYGGYLIADHLGASGPLETVAAGITLGLRAQQVMSPTTRLQARATWEFLDFLANSLLFLLMGLAVQPIGQITLSRFGISGLWRPLIVAIVAVVLARALVVWAVRMMLAHTSSPISEKWAVVLNWAGLRGAVSFAAALSIPSDMPYRNLLLTLTFGIVIFTLLAEGLTVAPLMERLGIGGDERSRHGFELALGRLATVEAALSELDMLRRGGTLDDYLAGLLAQRYSEERDQLRRELKRQGDTDVIRRQREYEALRHLLHVEREAAHEAYARGKLSRPVLRQIIEDIEHEFAQLEPVVVDEDE